MPLTRYQESEVEALAMLHASVFVAPEADGSITAYPLDPCAGSYDGAPCGLAAVAAVRIPAEG